MKKRYLVTYTDSKINLSTAREILSFTDQYLEEDFTSNSEEKSLNNSAVHFSNMAISSVELNEQEVEELNQRDDILAIEEDTEMFVLGFVDETGIQSENLWNIELVKAPEAWANNITGKGVNLAILDTGIANHPDLVISGGVSFVPGEPSREDENGHGTHCAGIAAGRKGLNKVFGVAKDCNLYAVKVLSKQGSGFTSWVISGMEWCIKNKIQVASMSLGSSSNPRAAYTRAVENCHKNGVTVVCASGNGFKTPFPWVGSPANSAASGKPSASPMAIGAVDRRSNIASFSSRGTNGPIWNPVTVVAPGVSIFSTYLNNGYKKLSGTSMACPHVAGLAALILEKNKNFTPLQVIEKVKSTATPLGSKEAYGDGLINCEKATS